MCPVLNLQQRQRNRAATLKSALKSWHFHATSFVRRNQDPVKKFRMLSAQGSKLNFQFSKRLKLMERMQTLFTTCQEIFACNSRGYVPYHMLQISQAIYFSDHSH
ncbi:unnamed protein product [Lathyrus sativus]|nr:unnamed protein product [Lathyrus sativus]